MSPPAAADSHPFARNLDNAVRRAQIVAEAASGLRQKGFIPDVICAHTGWGEALFLKDVFPESRLIGFFEFFYRGQGADVGFDPEFPTTAQEQFGVRAKNATSLLSLAACDQGVSPTHWQWSGFPEEFRKKISVIFDGIDTDLVRPDLPWESSSSVK